MEESNQLHAPATLTPEERTRERKIFGLKDKEIMGGSRKLRNDVLSVTFEGFS
jgi:hypothetical protein